MTSLRLVRALCLTALVAACSSREHSAPRAPDPDSSAAYRHAARARKPEDPALVWTPASVALVAREIASGVFAVYPDDAAAKNAAGVPAATSGGFVVGARGVLIVDTMINRELAGQLLALIREYTDKPVLYAVNTSYHGDHSYGNQFLPPSTQVIQHVNTQAYIQHHFPADVAFMTRYFGASSGLQELAPQPAAILLHDGETRTIDLGGKQVEIAHLGFAQTDGDLFVSVPADKVLFTGNPIISAGPAIPWLLDGHGGDSLATLRKLRAKFADDTKVVPGHGVPTTMATVDGHIAYLAQLEREVADAIAVGLDLAATTERVTQRMQARYGAYKIYPWVHTQLNIAKVYAELTQRQAVR